MRAGIEEVGARAGGPAREPVDADERLVPTTREGPSLDSELDGVDACAVGGEA